nr:hypothetical protein [Jeotgalibacillus malaysiensis]
MIDKLPGFAQPLAPYNDDEILSKVISISDRHYEFTKVKKNHRWLPSDRHQGYH